MEDPHRHKKSFDISISKRLLFFGRNSGIHGLGHLFQEDANFLARLFWLVVLLVSSGCLYLLLVPVVERGAEVNYTPDTLYLPWTTTFPAITVCEIYNPRAVQKIFGKKYPDLLAPLNFDFKRYLTDLLYARGACSKSLCVPCGSMVSCHLPWRDIVENIHKSCTDMLSECSYNGQQFACCKLFRAVDSEYGPCYSFNTLQGENPDNKPLASLNRSTGPGVVSFRILTDSHISVHSNEELSTNNLNIELKFDVKPRMENRVKFLFSLVQMNNDPLLQTSDTRERGCRYLHEIPNTPFHTYRAYSYGACRLARDTEHDYEHCSCVHPVRHKSYKDKYCNYTGLNCLVDHAAQKVNKYDNDIVSEDCLPSCVESELTTIHVARSWVPEEPGRGTMVNVQMAALPTLRYQRNLIRTYLDLVVSVAGMVGLFFSASILSLVEIFYLFFRTN